MRGSKLRNFLWTTQWMKKKAIPLKIRKLNCEILTENSELQIKEFKSKAEKL